VKVISIIQPWSTLIALGEKKYETRSWSTKHRGEIAIHSSRKIDKQACREEPIKSVLEKHGYTEHNLPIGWILAKCQIVGCYEAVTNDDENDIYAILENEQMISGNEYKFGNYTNGRFAWELSDVKVLDPIPAKGQLGLWNYDLEGKS
jgi:hypothetical protein